MIIHLHIFGVIFLLLATVHIGFPKYFDWARQLAPLRLIDRQMMYVHMAFIAITVLLIGLLCLTSAEDLIGTPLGRRTCLMLGVFWSLRLFTQFFIYSPKLWRGKPFETTVHILFSLLWCYAGTVFLWIALR